MTTLPHKVWKLTDARDEESVGPMINAQSIDYVWVNSTPGVYSGSCDHTRKITVRGDDAVTLAKFLVAQLNAVNLPDMSVQARVDRALIRAARQSPEMGSMATAGLFHTLALRSTDARFDEALEQASRPQLDALLTQCLHYITPQMRATASEAVRRGKLF